MKKVLFSLVAMLLFSVNGFAQTTFTKVTSASGLEAGANYLIVAHYDDLGVLAMGNQKSNNRNAVVVEENGDAITVTLGTDPNSETDVFQLTLGGSAGAWTLFDEVKGGYLYAASSGSNHLKTQTTLDANGQWSISFNDDGTAEVVAQGEYSHNNMRFNPNVQHNAPLFSCYLESSNISTRVSFYKAGSEAPDPEPSNYPTNFNAEVSGVNVTLAWADALGEQLPDGYLVLASTGNITVPADGVPVPDDALAKNVAYGTETVAFNNLQGGTEYHFAIFPYTNGGTHINYKTNDPYPLVSVTTEHIETLLFEDFDEELGVFAAYNVYGEQVWLHGDHQGTTYANMNGYANNTYNENEDWLISPAIEIAENTYNEISLEFRTAVRFEGPDLQVMVSMNYDGVGAPGEFDWIDITDAFDFSAGNYEWVESGQMTIGQPMLIPGRYHFAFVYTSTDEAAASWEIDYVRLTGKKTDLVDENLEQIVSVYPNPASDQVSLLLDSDAQLGFFDITGRKVSEMNVSASKAQLNVSEWESGIYFVHICYANGTTAVAKFVKL